jgi:hypothetical protein
MTDMCPAQVWRVDDELYEDEELYEIIDADYELKVLKNHE